MTAIQDSASTQSDEFHQYWWFMLLEGTLVFGLGIIAIAMPFFAGIVTTLVVGWLLVITGFLGLWTSWIMRKVKGQGWAALSSAVAILAGACFVAWPIAGLVSLTLVLGSYLAVDGVITIALARQLRRSKSGNWGLLLTNGILDLLLASAIVILFPGVDAWLLGVIVGVDLIFAGLSMIGVGWSAKAYVVRFHASGAVP